MKTKFYNIFKEKKVIIGVIHFSPLVGYDEFPGFDIILNNALRDLTAFEQGGVDGIIIENNYDIPHREVVSSEIVSMMISLGEKIKQKTKLPIGINVLWNDYRAGFLIAKKIGAKFIRIPVFVDKIKTDYGIITGDAKKALKYQRKIKAGNIALFADIHVKHAELLNKRLIQESALEAIKFGSDALIITGKWTGQAPNLRELSDVRKAVGDFPILIGSGADESNVEDLLKYANGIIVSTSVKTGDEEQGEVNVKNWKQRTDQNKVKKLVKIVKFV